MPSLSVKAYALNEHSKERTKVVKKDNMQVNEYLCKKIDEQTDQYIIEIFTFFLASSLFLAFRS